MKKHLFYTCLVLFVLTIVVTLVGVLGWVKVSEPILEKLVVGALVALTGSVVALLRQDVFIASDTTEPRSIRTIVKRETHTIKETPGREMIIPHVEARNPEIRNVEASQTPKIEPKEDGKYIPGLGTVSLRPLAEIEILQLLADEEPREKTLIAFERDKIGPGLLNHSLNELEEAELVMQRFIGRERGDKVAKYSITKRGLQYLAHFGFLK